MLGISFFEPPEEAAPHDTVWRGCSFLGRQRAFTEMSLPRSSTHCELVALTLVAQFLRRPPLVLTEYPCAVQFYGPGTFTPPARCSVALNALKYISSRYVGPISTSLLLCRRSRPTTLLLTGQAVSRPWEPTGWTAWRRRPLGEPTYTATRHLPHCTLLRLPLLSTAAPFPVWPVDGTE